VRRWRRVRMGELIRIWKSLRERGLWYNGCTQDELIRIYGPGNLIHKPGHGWYKLVEKEAA
jgi:hypothetical protein